MSSSHDRPAPSLRTSLELPHVDFDFDIRQSQLYRLATSLWNEHVANIDFSYYLRLASEVYTAHSPAFHFMVVAIVVSILIRLRQLAGIIWFCAGALSMLIFLRRRDKHQAQTSSVRKGIDTGVGGGVENGRADEVEDVSVLPLMEKGSSNSAHPAESVEARLDAFATLVEELKLELRQKTQAPSSSS